MCFDVILNSTSKCENRDVDFYIDIALHISRILYTMHTHTHTGVYNHTYVCIRIHCDYNESMRIITTENINME